MKKKKNVRYFLSKRFYFLFISVVLQTTAAAMQPGRTKRLYWRMFYSDLHHSTHVISEGTGKNIVSIARILWSKKNILFSVS